MYLRNHVVGNNHCCRENLYPEIERLDVSQKQTATSVITFPEFYQNPDQIPTVVHGFTLNRGFVLYGTYSPMRFC